MIFSRKLCYFGSILNLLCIQNKARQRNGVSSHCLNVSSSSLFEYWWVGINLHPGMMKCCSRMSKADREKSWASHLWAKLELSAHSFNKYDRDTMLDVYALAAWSQWANCSCDSCHFQKCSFLSETSSKYFCVSSSGEMNFFCVSHLITKLAITML